MRNRRNHDAVFKIGVALEAEKGERTGSEFAAAYGVNPTTIHQWKKALLDGTEKWLGTSERCRSGGIRLNAAYAGREQERPW